jgi:crotonobetainyl-CoA:carnitine CoA-transferase CaiB-like acyl-CoA transferase
MWKRVCAALAIPEQYEDPRTAGKRSKNRDARPWYSEEKLQMKTTAEWADLMPLGAYWAILSIDQVFANEQVGILGSHRPLRTLTLGRSRC